MTNMAGFSERSPEIDRAVAQRILTAVERGECRFVDLHFTDVTGGLKSVVIPAGQLHDVLRYGHWFDGSSLEGSARLMETDLILQPVLSTWGRLPWETALGDGTGRFICDIRTPDGAPYPADPRAVLARAVADAADAGFAYQAAAEVEFYLFQARPQPPSAASGWRLRPIDAGGYFDVPAQGDRVRDAITLALNALGVPVEGSHHELGPGQHEIDLPLLPALDAADAITTCKFVVRAIARRHGLVATFMPRPLAGAAGSGLHLHQSLRDRSGADVLADPSDEHGLSPGGKAFIAGQLAHARAMCAVVAPGVNSYKRLGRGFDAPSHVAWSHSSPLAIVRVPRLNAAGARRAAGRTPRAAQRPMRVELRCPDPSCNAYLALAVALASGLDGLRTSPDLPAPIEPAGIAGPAGPFSATGVSPDDLQLETLPASLGEAVHELAWDPVVRNALGAPVYERLLAAKEQEWQAYRRYVSPWELDRYFESA